MRVEGGLPYVSRGGLKLDAALDTFGVAPTGWVCGDVGHRPGASLTVFSRAGRYACMRWMWGMANSRGRCARIVRVISIERANIRLLASLPERVTFAAIDVSFIGLSLVLPCVADLFAPAARSSR